MAERYILFWFFKIQNLIRVKWVSLEKPPERQKGDGGVVDLISLYPLSMTSLTLLLDVFSVIAAPMSSIIFD